MNATAHENAQANGHPVFHNVGENLVPARIIGRIYALIKKGGKQLADATEPSAQHGGTALLRGNTCYRGGKPGVSDVFAAALWAADYSLFLAANNYSGINCMTAWPHHRQRAWWDHVRRPGSQRSGRDAGAIATHPHAYYSPIAEFDSTYVLEPVAYWLFFAGLMAGGTLIHADLTAELQAAGINATAYAAKLLSGKHPSSYRTRIWKTILPFAWTSALPEPARW